MGEPTWRLDGRDSPLLGHAKVAALLLAKADQLAVGHHLGQDSTVAIPTKKL
jgi:hypothetical protein